jgi:hypothetical protein
MLYLFLKATLLKQALMQLQAMELKILGRMTIEVEY